MTQATRALVAAAFMAMMASGSRADVFVVQVGDGAAALTNASTSLAVQKFTNNGTPISAIPLPIAAADQNLPFTVNGTAVSEGFLTLSGNGQFLTLAGYSIAPGTAQINTTASTVAPRAVARIDVGSGAVNTSTSFSGDTTFSAGNARSAVSSDGSSIWLAGSNQGVRTTTFGTTASTVVSSTVTNNRVLNIFNGQLYVSSGSGSFIGVNAVGTGLPTATGLAT
ncbi:MAG TPA: hypothetical protein VEQ85_06375, partial [Lacipirellulaceae bacterium]|nr:hypothetical protein [Lacipirellulaceae bacterium]